MIEEKMMTTRVYDVKKQKNTLNRIIVLILIIIEILLVSRLMNNPSLIDQGFVSTLSMISKVLIIPFESMFSSWIASAMSTQSVVDVATVVSMAMYALIASVIIVFSNILKDNEDRVIRL
jgi:hypothetical protein